MAEKDWEDIEPSAVKLMKTTPTLENEGEWEDIETKLPFSPREIPGIIGRNLKEAARITYREGISPFVHGSSTMALGLPKQVAQKTGTKDIIYPEQESVVGKSLRGVSELAGFTVGGALRGGQWLLKGAQKVLPKLAGKGFLKTATRYGITGTGAGLLQAPEKGEGFIRPEERLEQAGMFGATGAALPIAGSVAGVLAKSGRWIAKNVGGVTDATVETINRLGADRVFEPLKAQAEYIGKEIVPRVVNRTKEILGEGSKLTKGLLSRVGWKADEIDEVAKINPGTLKNILFRTNVEDPATLTRAIETNRLSADMYYKKVFNEGTKEKKTLGIKNTFYRLKDALEKQGWVDKQGNKLIGSGIPNKTKDNLIKIFNDLRKSLVTEGKTRVTGTISPREYLNKLSELDASMVGDLKFDRHIFTLQRSLRDEVATQIKGLDKANKLYADAMKLIELEPKIQSALDPKGWQTKINQVGKDDYFQRTKILKPLVGEQNYDDIMAHLANKDFELVTSTPGTGGGFYPSRSGFLRSAVDRGTKRYYQDIKPQFLKAKEFGEKTFKNIEQERNKPLKFPIGANLKGKRGSVGFEEGEGSIKEIIEKAGGKFKGISDIKNSIYEGDKTVYFDDVKGSTKTLPFSKLTEETIKQKLGLLGGVGIGFIQPKDTEASNIKIKIAKAENYGKMEGDWAQLENIVLEDLKQTKKLPENITLKQVKEDPKLYNQVVSLYLKRMDDFGIPENQKALWWLMPGRYKQTGGDINKLNNPKYRNIMKNRIRNISK